MGKFSKEDLVSMKDDHYEKLVSNPDSLIESQDALDELSASEQVTLVTAMLLKCKPEDISSLRGVCRGLRPRVDVESGFHQVFSQGLEVYSRLHSLINTRNAKPYQLFLDAECNRDMFNQFLELTQHIVQANMEAIVTRLVFFTPAGKESRDLMRNKAGFPGEFWENLAAAFSLKAVLNTLNSPSPQEAFKHMDFSPALFARFPVLVSLCLREELETIADNLAKADPSQDQLISESLQSLMAVAEQEEGFFKTIYDAFLEKRNNIAAPTSPLLALSLYSKKQGPTTKGMSQEKEEADVVEIEGNAL